MTRPTPPHRDVPPPGKPPAGGTSALRRAPIRRRPADNHLPAAVWAELFHRLLERTGGQCEGRTPDCLAPGGSVLGMARERVSVQHRRARGMGGTDDGEGNLANLLLLCGSGVTGCHGWVEIRERAAALARGLWVPHGTDAAGVAVPVHTHPLVLWSGRRVLLDPVVPVYLPHPNPWGALALEVANG